MRKEDLWDEKLKINFRFPEGKLELVKRHRFLNMKYIQKGLTPFQEYGKITLSQWAELMAEKTSLEALALSAHNSEQATKNQHHPCLGPGGYAGKEEVFRKMDEEAEASGNTKVKSLKPHIRN
jgi:hypothetical protein